MTNPEQAARIADRQRSSNTVKYASIELRGPLHMTTPFREERQMPPKSQPINQPPPKSPPVPPPPPPPPPQKK